MKKSNKATYVFQKDDAPAHTANIVKKCMGTNINFWSKNLRSPQRQDLNPLDYSICCPLVYLYETQSQSTLYIVFPDVYRKPIQ
uniref:Uncharacterized protein n=1 Tax=Lepeophtheirus salmonis TaxID=72036 RepID=A0A0K2UQ64_LEPSM